MASKPRVTDVARSDSNAPVVHLRQAYRVYVSKKVRQDLMLPSLRILASLLGTQELGREPEALFAAALYIAFRHPNTYPNLVPRSHFSAIDSKLTKRKPAEPLFKDSFGAKDTSIDWYSKRIVEKLGIIVLYDERGLPYFLEKTGPIYRLIEALGEEAAIDAVLSSHISNRPELLEPVLSGLLNRIFTVLKLLPRVFYNSLYDHLAPHVEALIDNAKWAIGL
ncbi:MAG: hypothetical protein ACFFD8_00275 [Candidatus Thorarchaeota archaeon]